MLSPVWTPMGSMFSMLQMAIQVSLASRITSYSISFQPVSARSTRTWRMGLAARDGYQSIVSFWLDDRRDRLDCKRLVILPVRDPFIRHDRCRVRVDQYGSDSFLAKRLPGLGPRVIELGRLPDHDWAGSDD